MVANLRLNTNQNDFYGGWHLQIGGCLGVRISHFSMFTVPKALRKKLRIFSKNQNTVNTNAVVVGGIRSTKNYRVPPNSSLIVITN